MRQNETFEKLLDEQAALAGQDTGKETASPEVTFGTTETMEDYAKELEASYKRVARGDILQGTVISVDDEGLILDLDYFTPGKVPPEQISPDPTFDYVSRIHIGDKLSAAVLSTDDGSGYMLMSVKEAAADSAWEKLRALQAQKQVVSGRIAETVPAGAILYVEGVRGFIPVSKLSLQFVEDTSVYQGQTVRVQIIEADEEQNRLVLSARELLAQEEIARKNEKVNRIKADTVVEGTVKEIKDYGAFVDIGDGITGLLHISQISEQRIKHPRAVLKEGDKIRVKIIKVADGKVSLSMKVLAEIAAREEEENLFDYHSEGDATTGLGELLKGIKL